MNMKKIRLGNYISLITDYHSGGSYQTLKEKTKILHKPDYGVYVRTINFESDNFDSDLVYCDEASYNFLEYSHVKENDILMNKIANPGSVYLMPKVSYKATCGLNLFLIRLKDISQRYMYYVMKHNEKYIKSKAHGTSTKTITKDEVRDLSFYIHEKTDDQIKVEKTLSIIEQKIAINKKINKEIENMAKELYDYWFIQFDFPGADGKPYKSSGGKMIYNPILKTEIPEGWEVKKLGYILTKNTCSFDYKSVQPTIDLSVMPSDSIALSQINSSNNFTSNLFVMKKKDILFGSIRPYLHKAGIAPCDGVVAGTVHSYRIRNSNDYNFALLTICRSQFFDYALNISYGTKMPIVNSDDILDYKVPYSAEVSKLFNEIDIADCITNLISENHRLTKLRDELLPLLMNGQVSVK